MGLKQQEWRWCKTTSFVCLINKILQINSIRLNCVQYNITILELFEASKYSKNFPRHIYSTSQHSVGIIVVSLVFNFKPFIIFISDRKLNRKIEVILTKNNVDVSNL